MPQRTGFHLPLFVLAALGLGLACSAANQERAQIATGAAEAACVVIARSQEPGAETLCATGKEITDALIAVASAYGLRPAGATSPPAPQDPQRELCDAILRGRASAP